MKFLKCEKSEYNNFLIKLQWPEDDGSGKVKLLLGFFKYFFILNLWKTDFRISLEPEPKCYGIVYFQNSFMFYLGDKCKVFDTPWSLVCVRNDLLTPDGGVYYRNLLQKRGFPQLSWFDIIYFENGILKQNYKIKNNDENNIVKIAEIIKDFKHTDKYGDTVLCDVLLLGEEREWRRKWLTFSKLFNIVQRTVSIEFSKPVGVGNRSWKGGLVGCGSKWVQGETLKDAFYWWYSENCKTL